jgi:tetratricopeptide (TPR) repeat protein
MTLWSLLWSRKTRLSAYFPKFILPLTIFAGFIPALQAQQSQSPAEHLQQSIAHDLELIQTGERMKLPPEKMGILWERLASAYQELTNYSQAESSYQNSLQFLATTQDIHGNYTTTFENLCSLYLQTARWSDAESCRKSVLAIRQRNQDQRGIAMSYTYLAQIELGEHWFKDAERYASLSYEKKGWLDARDQDVVVGTLLTRAYARCYLKKIPAALEDIQAASDIALTAFGPNSLPMGEAKFAFGIAQWKQGHMDQAMDAMRQGLDTIGTHLVQENPYLIGARMQYRQYPIEAHHPEEAKQVDDQIAVSMRHTAPLCKDCVVSTMGLANTWR